MNFAPNFRKEVDESLLTERMRQPIECQQAERQFSCRAAVVCRNLVGCHRSRDPCIQSRCGSWSSSRSGAATLGANAPSLVQGGRWPELGVINGFKVRVPLGIKKRS